MTPVVTLTGSGTASPSGFALSIDVTGTQITAAANLQSATSSCGPFGATLGAGLTGTVAPDGTFTIASPASTPVSLFPAFTVKGTVPASAQAPWKGSYTVSSTTPSFNNSPPCTATLSGTFEAAAVQDVDGTFTGNGSFTTFGNPAAPTSAPLSMTLMLHQGGTLYGPRPGASLTSRLALSGSMQVQGLNCFSQGDTSTSLPSLVEGNRITAAFTAADGTVAQVFGSIVDTATTEISIDTVLVQGAQCNNTYDFFGTPLIVQR